MTKTDPKTYLAICHRTWDYVLDAYSEERTAIIRE
jgi:hypothetical protein